MFSTDDIRGMFTTFDRTRKGKITSEEVYECLAAIGVKSVAVVKPVYSLDEFIDFMYVL